MVNVSVKSIPDELLGQPMRILVRTTDQAAFAPHAEVYNTAIVQMGIRADRTQKVYNTICPVFALHADPSASAIKVIMHHIPVLPLSIPRVTDIISITLASQRDRRKRHDKDNSDCDDQDLAFHLRPFNNLSAATRLVSLTGT